MGVCATVECDFVQSFYDDTVGGECDDGHIGLSNSATTASSMVAIVLWEGRILQRCRSSTKVKQVV